MSKKEHRDSWSIGRGYSNLCKHDGWIEGNAYTPQGIVDCYGEPASKVISLRKVSGNRVVCVQLGGIKKITVRSIAIRAFNFARQNP